jgi:hypothetical protein
MAAQKPIPPVALTILQQLGGNKFIAMTGAKNFISLPNGLAFQLPKAKNGINKVKITLNGLDLYDVEYGKMRKLEYKIVATDDNIYDDMLQECFTAQTGLDTHL